MAYDKRITDLAAIAAAAAAKNAGTAPQLLLADITFALADAVDDGRIALGRMDNARSRLFGFSDVWRSDGTGTQVFWLFWLPLWRSEFWHSTTFLDD